MTHDTFIWITISLCIAQSGVFSGLNLALFSLSRLRLEIEAERGAPGARKVLELRKNSNFTLTTVLWGNVAVNTLLAQLSESVLMGIGAFFFATVGITVFGEIVPQAYFSRHAMRMGALFSPLLRFYQILLYPVAKPSALLLDRWLGREGLTYLREQELKAMIQKHMEAKEADLERGEGVGLLNYLALDDLPLEEEGEPIDPRSIIALPINVDLPILPAFEAEPDDPFVRKVQESGKKWVVLTDNQGDPKLVLDADAFIRGIFTRGSDFNPYEACHRPIVVKTPETPIGRILPKLLVGASHSDDVIDHDLVLLWTEQRRVLTGADILGRLLRGITRRRKSS